MLKKEKKYSSQFGLTIALLFVGILAFNSILFTFNVSMNTGKNTVNNLDIYIPEFKNSDSLPQAGGIHAPITIDGDDWTTSGVADGTGTLSDPYIIANLTIIGDGSSGSKGISITNSHKYGIIRNVSFSNSSYGISIENSETITIENSSFINCSEEGIHLSDSNYCNMSNNLMENISFTGIKLLYSNFSVIEDNTIKNSFRGIYILNSNNNNIGVNQIFDNSETGIIISNSNSCSVEENFIDNNVFWGISISGSEFITVNANNLTNNLQFGINLGSFSKNCTVSNNTIYNSGGHGLLVSHSNDNIIIGNSITYNHGFGILFEHDTSSNEVTQNILIKNSQGSTNDVSGNNNIHDNTIIEMLAVSFTSSESPIEVNIPVNFTDTSIGGLPPLIYSWDFDDGESSDEQNPSHNYTTSGNYTVSLTVTDKDGDQSTFSMMVIIIEGEKSEGISGYTLPTLFAVAALMTTAIILKTKRKFSCKA